MKIGQMAKDAHRVFRAHPDWRYGLNRYRPKKRHIRETIQICLDGLRGPGSSCETGRFMARCDEEGVISVWLELGGDDGGI